MADTVKELVFARAMAEAKGFGLEVCEQDAKRPWGGFLKFTEASLPAFTEAYLQGVEVNGDFGKRDPKVLLVAPGARLSLQLHHRRSELWRVLDGPVTIVRGHDEANLSERVYQSGEAIHLDCGEIHRLCGGENNWGRVAEIWEHSDASNPSNEADIVRLQDDYAR